ncbi:MAG: riboflavin synthase [Lachnospiraceae bacterium]|nr:riboflavin synthase [Lachnospiraceae bacterium]
MFTGIVEEKGCIRGIRPGAKSCILTIEGNVIFSDLRVGDSVAVNGVCLTATGISGRLFTADVMRETLERSSLGSLRTGSHVNLERAMAADGRFGGHIVSGHIDGTGAIVRIEKDDNAIWYTVEASPSIMRYIVEKGSIAIDGISLTVAKITGSTFSVSIIPHTAKETILSEKRTGDVVNLENDVISKYVEKLLGLAPECREMKKNSETTNQSTGSRGISLEWLAENGF